MLTKIMCALVAMLFCFSAIAAAKPNAQQLKLARAARGVLGEYCGNCHGTGGSYYDKMQINHEWLRDEGFVIPNKPNESDLYTIINKRMPKPLGPDESPKVKVPNEKLDIIKRWIEAGAHDWKRERVLPEPITHEQMLKWMRDDLMDQPRGDRRDIRYFTLTHLYNAGEPPDAMHNYRTALSKLVNSLSDAEDIVKPKPIDDGQTILRILLSDYKWDQNIWNKISLNGPEKPGMEKDFPYPYEIDHGKSVQEQLQNETSPIPFIRADWFIANAAKPQLYHEILRLPDTDLELENDWLSLPNVADNIRNGISKSFMRAGFLESGVSKFNRIVERHKNGKKQAYWKSYDFSSNISDNNNNGNINNQNIFRHPLGPGEYWPNGIDKPAKQLFKAPAFQQAGGEIIFTLNNGLQGYFLVNGQGKRIDEAPINIVRNLNSEPGNDPVISTGLSCMTCHTRGMKSFDLRAGDLRKSIEKADANKIRRNYKRAVALRTYSEAATINKQVEKDAKNFEAAVEDTGGVVGTQEPIALLATQYEGPLDIYLAAGELGVTKKVMEQCIKKVRALQEYGLHTLLVEDGPGLARESWEQNYKAIYDEVYKCMEGIGGPPEVLFPLTLEAFINRGGPVRAQQISGLAWSPDANGTTIISTGGPKLFEFDATNWQPRDGVPPEVEPTIVDRIDIMPGAILAFSPTQPNRLAVNNVNSGIRSLRIFDLDALHIKPLEITLSKQKKLLAALKKEAGDELDKDPNLNAEKKKETLDGIKANLIVNHFAWKPDGTKIAVSGTRFNVIPNMFRDLQSAKSLFAQKKHVVLIVNSRNNVEIALQEFDPRFPKTLDWSPDGDMLGIIVGGTLEIWDAQDGGIVGQHVFERAKQPLKRINAVGLHMDWSPKNAAGKINKKFDSHIAVAQQNHVTIVSIGIDGNNANGLKNVVSEEVRIPRAHIRKNPRDDLEVVLAWSPNGRRLATGVTNRNNLFGGNRAAGEIRIWDPFTLKPLPANPNDLNLNQPIQTLIIEPKQGERGNPKIFFSAGVSSLAWRPDGKQLAAGLLDQSVRVFDKLK